ncbi:unnamed protein product [Symbiodinium microadriaticum]|nr:unnamed protein product [Symbiodinium microadriaticum]CAE7566800.1 unnamed protein product [Symbiodinium sp. KB8]
MAMRRPVLFVLAVAACVWLFSASAPEAEEVFVVQSPALRGQAGAFAGSSIELAAVESPVVLKALPEPRPNDAMLPVELNRTSLYWGLLLICILSAPTASGVCPRPGALLQLLLQLKCDGESFTLLSAKPSKFSVFFTEAPAGFTLFVDDSDVFEEQDGEPQLREMLETGGWAWTSVPEHQAFEIAAWLCCSARQPSSFGRMLAFVKRAHNVLKLLGKNKGRLVPYCESEDWIRRSNVLLRAPTGVDIGERYVADEKVLCDCLHHLLVDQQGWLGMADIKRLFRSRFGAEISETAFGCASMTELLSQPFIRARFYFQPDWERGCGYLSFSKKMPRRQQCNIRTLQDRMTVLRHSEAAVGSVLKSCSHAASAATYDTAPEEEHEMLSWQGLRALSPMYIPASHLQTPPPRALNLGGCGDPDQGDLLTPVKRMPGRNLQQETNDDAEQDAAGAPQISPLPPWCSVKRTFINCDGVRGESSPTSRSHSAPSRTDDSSRQEKHWTKID